MKWILGVLGALLLAIAALAGVVAYRTSQYGNAAGSEPAITLPDPPAFDLNAAADSLGAAIRIQTVTYQAGDPKPGATQPWFDLHAHLGARYPAAFAAMTVETVAEHSLLMTWAGSDASLPPLILMAHQDVVPVNPGTEKDWTHPPFDGVVSDGVIWGRGAMDDKGSLIAILEAADALAKSGWKPKRTVILLFGHDEEVSGAGAQAMFALLKSRGVKPVMVLDEGYAVLANYPLTGKPTALIGVAEKGYVSVKITANTEGGHSSRPPRDSGAVRIARALVALEENQMPADLTARPFGEMVEAIAADLPYATRLAFANQWLLKSVIEAQLSDATASAIVRTTTAPTMMEGSIKDNVLPQRASAVINFRVHPNDSVAKVIEHVKTVTSGIKDLTVETYGEGIASEPSPVSSTTSEAYQVLKAVAKAAGGGAEVPAAPGLVIGATDARFATAISEDAIDRFHPAIYTDADLSGFHGTNEQLTVENLGRMIRGYAQLMMALCS